VKAGVVTGLLAGALVLGGCTSTKVGQPTVDAVLHDLAGSARASYDQGDIDRAGELYERALDRARLVGDTGEAARNAYNLALCRLARGRATDARALLAEARVGLPSRGAEAARVLLAEAEAARQEGKADDARLLAERALASGADRAGRGQAHLDLADLACGSNDVVSAKRLLSAAEKDLGPSGAPVLQARAAGVAARLAETAGDALAVAVAREREAEWLRQAGNHQAMAIALAAAGESYRKAGQPRKAFPCLWRAAASLKGGGAMTQAGTAAASAVEAAREAGDKDWVTAAEALVTEVRKP